MNEEKKFGFADHLFLFIALVMGYSLYRWAHAEMSFFYDLAAWAGLVMMAASGCIFWANLFEQFPVLKKEPAPSGFWALYAGLLGLLLLASDYVHFFDGTRWIGWLLIVGFCFGIARFLVLAAGRVFKSSHEGVVAKDDADESIESLTLAERAPEPEIVPDSPGPNLFDLSRRQLVELIADGGFRDADDSRDYQEFELLKTAINMEVKQDEFLELCSEQISQTPDYDLPYLWASGALQGLGRRDEAISILVEGLRRCKRASNLLQKLGVRFLESGDPSLMTTLFAEAIQTQAPMRSSYEPYLYYSYVCKFSEYGNLAEKSLAIARGIFGDIDLDFESQDEIRRLTETDLEGVQNVVRLFLPEMLERGTMD